MNDAYTILQHPINTEKAVRLMDKENKMLFSVARKATKTQIKKAFEELFNAKVVKVNTFTTPEGEKRAYITLSKQQAATDVATKLGLM